MSHVFPTPIRNLPKADIPLVGLTAYLSQADTHQILFMEFEKDTEVPEHTHAGQYAIVLEGKIELLIDGKKRVYTKGDRYYISEGVVHSAKVYAGYADITFFNEPHRY
jgi:quercetin dioxygenase-like cupin family protein